MWPILSNVAIDEEHSNENKPGLAKASATVICLSADSKVGKYAKKHFSGKGRAAGAL